MSPSPKCIIGGSYEQYMYYKDYKEWMTKEHMFRLRLINGFNLALFYPEII
jgi:hypothetical protein